MDQSSSPLFAFLIVRLPAPILFPPATAVTCMGLAVAVTCNCGKYEALQSPTTAQSEGGVTAAKRGMGAVVEAEVTVETGASDRLPVAAAGALWGPMAKKLGIWALSVADWLASTTSYTTYPAPLVRGTELAPSRTSRPEPLGGGSVASVPPVPVLSAFSTRTSSNVWLPGAYWPTAAGVPRSPPELGTAAPVPATASGT